MPTGTRLLRRPYLVVVSLVVGFNLWSFRTETLPVSYLYDAPVHLKMVQFATHAISHGRLPLTAWFPYLGLGSAQFLHYQSLGAVLTGLAGTIVGAGTAFRWAVYLLVSFWPYVVYSSARIFRVARPASMVAAAISPFVVSYTGIAFERGAYSWIGGAEVWAQLFGMWLLPYAWACTWRALEDSRFIWLAALTTGLTFAFHFLCGYLAFFGIMVLALVAAGPWKKRLSRAAVVLGGSLASAIWVILPLMAFAKWSAINEVLAETPYVRGYGATQELKWLFKGEIFDARRSLAVLSVLVLVGIIAALASWHRAPLGRGLIALFVGSLLLSFGGTTWGPLIDVVPAHADLYFRRFSMGTQLAGIYLAGTGVVTAWTFWWRFVSKMAGLGVLRGALAGYVTAIAAWCYPAVSQIYHYDRSDASTIHTQRLADSSDGALLAPIIGYLETHPNGRVYAGQSSNWGQKFDVGYVPVYKYLLDQDVEESTYIVPTTSLMLGAEPNFDDSNPADYSLFGISYILLPSGLSAPVPAKEIMAEGPYSLWQIEQANGPQASAYAELVRVTAEVPANRADIGTESIVLLDTIGPGEDWAVRWPGVTSHISVFPAQGATAKQAQLGSVLSVSADLADGKIDARVDVKSPSALLFSVAFDPGWHAWVDGRPAATEMLAPALVGVSLSPGLHELVLRYEGFGWYPELWAASILTLISLAIIGRRGPWRWSPASSGR
ncbi:MAG TPA: YfhO family protein [Acidimicrobiales bacterium]|nr:YfhO family protein [Acidimicrobiales bacterium]